MRIAFDHSIFTIQSFGGVSRYITRLAQHLNHPDDAVRVFAPLHQNQYLEAVPPVNRFGFRVNSYPKLLKSMARTTNFIIAKHAISNWKPDILHETYFGVEAIRPKNAALVMTMHDMITEIYPEKFPKAALATLRKKQALERAAHVICISENTRKDLHRFFDVPTNKVSVVYHGVDLLPISTTSIEPSKTPYFLYVGSRLEYKNFQLFVQAFASSKLLKRDFKIVAFGGGPFTDLELQSFTQLGLAPEHIRYASGSDQVLAHHYAHAQAFVYPTQYEGFGFPPLEAMALGCPVVCSNSSCIPEIVGDAALQFDPRSTQELRSALEKLATNSTFRYQLIVSGKKHHQKFSWNKCANETRLIYAALR